MTAGVVAAALPALGQQRDAPESILPPGFGDPPAATPAPTPTPTTPSPTPQSGTVALGQADGNALTADLSDATDDGALAATAIDPAMLARYEIPPFARRSLDVTGIAGPGDGGLVASAFGRADGRYLETLMGRLDAPIASRWLSIALRRALASRLLTPNGVNGADFAAERAWLLVRMGEPVVARAVVQSVDPPDFTPKLYEAALQSMLAAADPAGLCPHADRAAGMVPARAWTMAQAFCAGLAGYPEKAGDLLNDARRRGVASGIDLLLAEKVLGTGASGRQAVTIEWDGVDQLTAWRYGLATATGTEIPNALFGTVDPRVRLWQAQAPTLDPRVRAPLAELAAAQGVLSSAALIDLYGAIEGGDDQTSAEVGVARDLRSAYTDADVTSRQQAMHRLWDDAKTDRARYARLILTARAATLVPADAGNADADTLIASMLSAGFENQALRWRNAVQRGSNGWAMLAIADPVAARLSQSDITAYQQRGGSTGGRGAMFFAALAGLGRVAPGDLDGLAGSLGVDLRLNNPWTRAIDLAAARQEPGTVLLLAAIGMQTADWRGVSPDAFYRMIAAMHRVGLDAEAHMLAIEALTRR